jgi:hypothetical protein
MDKLRLRAEALDGTSRDLSRRSETEKGSERALEHLETFCARIEEGLDNMSFEERQDLLRLVVDSISVENETVKVETIIPSGESDNQLRTRRGEPIEPPIRQRLFRPTNLAYSRPSTELRTNGHLVLRPHPVIPQNCHSDPSGEGEESRCWTQTGSTKAMRPVSFPGRIRVTIRGWLVHSPFCHPGHSVEGSG